MLKIEGAPRWALWFGLLLLVTLVLHTERDYLDRSVSAFTLLLVVVGGSSAGGRWLGFSLAVAAFLLIDYFFQPPFDQLDIGGLVNWVALLAFLAAAFATTELLTRAKTEAENARRFAREVEQARELREANRAKDEVLASVSHDLRTPLTAIKLLAQEAASRGEPNGPVIEAQANRLAGLVTNVLDLSRIRAGAMPLDIDVNMAEDLVGAAVDRPTGLLDGRTLVHRVELTEPALAGRFDFPQSLRILGNLIDNAIRYSTAGGLVELHASRSGEWLVFSVADRGPGVRLEDRDRIFEPFHRSSSEAGKAGHAGLGLHIARRLAELQGGRLEYRARDGGGSEFLFCVPSAHFAAIDNGLPV